MYHISHLLLVLFLSLVAAAGEASPLPGGCQIYASPIAGFCSSDGDPSPVCCQHLIKVMRPENDYRCGKGLTQSSELKGAGMTFPFLKAVYQKCIEQISEDEDDYSPVPPPPPATCLQPPRLPMVEPTPPPPPPLPMVEPTLPPPHPHAVELTLPPPPTWMINLLDWLYQIENLLWRVAAIIAVLMVCSRKVRRLVLHLIGWRRLLDLLEQRQRARQRFPRHHVRLRAGGRVRASSRGDRSSLLPEDQE